MRDFINKSKIILSNENGGPNLEHLIGIAVSMAIVGVACYIFKISVYEHIKSVEHQTKNQLA